MTSWTTPEFLEIDMSAEIGSYQEDSEPREDWTDRLSPVATEEKTSA
ncbi:MAG TPA: hypothetical protein VGP93_08360 [Polyangiaceae bacterium]|nr:hypothetical protein [Polyangiaceae bacterium]